MSLNFYARTPDTAPEDEGLHIGQHVRGTEFLFRAHPKLGLTDCASWRAFLAEHGIHIIAEHGVEYTLDEFWVSAARRPADVGGPNALHPRWRGNGRRAGESRDVCGHPFAAYEFC